jgi:L-lactate dehydrogenase complex protein LldF
MLLALRGAAMKEDRQPRSLAAAMKVYAWMATRPRVYRLMVRMGGWWLRRLARDGWIRRAPGLAGGWTRSRDLKAPAARNFQQRWRERQRNRGRAA